MFSLIIPGRPCLTDMVTVSPNQFAFNFPTTPHFHHVVVFILPGNVLPEGSAAAVYMQLPGETTFRFLGAIANEKPSAIFKVNLPGSGQQNQSHNQNQDQDEMSDDITLPGGGLPSSGTHQGTSTTMTGVGGAGVMSLGISVEPIAGIQAQLAQLKTEQQLSSSSTSNVTTTGTGNTTALMKRPPSTKVLAQRIIKNAFNFLASFAGGQGGQEVVPLKSFEEWWKKFERRVENDPGFLERDDD